MVGLVRIWVGRVKEKREGILPVVDEAGPRLPYVSAWMDEGVWERWKTFCV